MSLLSAPIYHLSPPNLTPPLTTSHTLTPPQTVLAMRIRGVYCPSVYIRIRTVSRELQRNSGRTVTFSADITYL